MKRLLYFVVFISFSKIISCSNSKIDYVNLILDVMHAYKPSAVILLLAIDTENISDMKIFFDLMLEFTRKKMPITTVELTGEKHPSNKTDLENGGQEIREASRSMSIILFSSKSAIEKLNNISERIVLHVAVNLILFMTNDLPSSGFCIEWFRNKFKFSFLGSIIFKCYGDTMIRKWYPYNANGIEFIIWGIWEPNKRLIRTKSNSVHVRRANLDGKVFKVATVKDSPLARWKDGKPVGYLIEIMQMLEKIMNFKINYTKEEEKYGIWSNSRKTWSGAISLAVKGEVDMIISDFSITPQRLLGVDFTTPLFLQEDVLYIKKPTNGMTIFWRGYFEPFHYEIWIAIGLLIATIPLILALMTLTNLKINSFSVSSLICDCYFNVWGMFCQQGLHGIKIEVPTISSLKLAYFSISLCSFILMAIYSAVLISYLAVPILNLPFSTLNGFVRDGSYKMIVQKDGSIYAMFKNSNNSIYAKMNKLMMPEHELPTTVDDAFKMVCNRKIAYYGSEILDEMINKNISCQVVKIHSGRFDSTGMVLRKRSPHKSEINYHLNHLRDKGILNRVKSKYFLKTNESKTTNFNSIGIKGIAVLLVILSVGIVLSLTLLFFEKYNAKLR